MVGINSAVRANANSIGFAIPINMVKQLLPMLLRDGQVTRSAIGRAHRATSAHSPTTTGGPSCTEARRAGAGRARSSPGGPADKAGLQPGDVIVAFEAKPIERDEQLRWLANTAGVGRAVTVGRCATASPRPGATLAPTQSGPR